MAALEAADDPKIPPVPEEEGPADPKSPPVLEEEAEDDDDDADPKSPVEVEGRSAEEEKLKAGTLDPVAVEDDPNPKVERPAGLVEPGREELGPPAADDASPLR